MNKVILIGRLTKDIELKKTTSGTSVTNFSLAVDRAFKQDNQPTADFISCQAWSKTAELMNNYLKKGSKIGIEGRIQTGSYQASDGSTRHTTDVIVERLEFLDSKKNQEAPKQTSTNNEFSDLSIDDELLPF